MASWEASRVLEGIYEKALNKVVREYLKQIKGLTNLNDMLQALQQVGSSVEFHRLANLMATRFVTHAEIHNARNWREAAKQASNGRKIYESLRGVMNNTHVGIVAKNQILENATLIKTLPLDVSREVTKFVATEAFRGMRSEDIGKLLYDKIGQYSGARVQLIARTETSKAMTALTEARSRDLGINWYVWKTANDGMRVREAHRNMHGVLCRFDEPPAPEVLVGEKSEGHYNAGNIYNCRCLPRPLIDIDNVSWPCRVHIGGSILTMSKKQFIELNK